MRVLVISNVPLKKENSLGNTLLSLLGDIEGMEIANIYTRNGIPDGEVAAGFCITEAMLLRNLLKKTAAGMRVQPVKTEDVRKSSAAEESSAVRFVKAKRWTVFFWIQDLVWKLGRWKSPELKRFVADFDPDVVLTVLLNSVCLNDLVLHVLSLTKAKFVLYAWDNNYSLKMPAWSALRWIKRLIDRGSMRKVARKSDLFYVISRVQKEDYERCFRKPCKVLTKGADFEKEPDLKTDFQKPMQLVFTGNIGTNRWKSLKMIADVLEHINAEGTQAQLRIYTATPLTEEMKKALERKDSSFLMGRVPAREVPRIQADADILVHVEAMDLANKLRVRQSFSTKIVDYLKAGRPILALGPKDVASIDHLVRNDCAVVAENIGELEEKLRWVLNNTVELDRVTRNAYECGRRHHNKPDIRRMLQQDLENLCGR